MPKKPVTLLLLSAASPMQIGLYDEKGALLEQQQLAGKASSELYPAFEAIDRAYQVTALAYARGPGSFMGLKLGFVFLRSYAIAKNIPMYAADSFYFTGGYPIMASRVRAYFKSGEEISIGRLESPPESGLRLPDRLNLSELDAPLEPLYIQPAV